MRSPTNREDSEIRALSALKALEDERIAREAALASGPRARMARGTAPQAAVPELSMAEHEQTVERLAQAAEAAVERYRAAEQYAPEEADLDGLMREAEAAIGAYETAHAELERAAARPIPLSREVWPTVKMPAPQPDELEMVAPVQALPRRGGMRKVFGGLLGLGVAGVVAALIAQGMQSGSTTTTEPTSAPAISAPKPAAEPALTPAEKARKEWEAQQAQREADRAKRRKRRSSKQRRPKPIDPNSKVRVRCDPNDPLCGV